MTALDDLAPHPFHDADAPQRARMLSRLADTELLIEVERDLTIPGEEVKFGGGKVVRDGMGQSQVTREGGAMDTVITGVVVFDHQGITKADVGLRDGRIAGIGKAGNPDTQPGVTLIIGPGTEIIAGEGRILTPGGFDCHIHYICPQQVDHAIHSGVTTLLGGGTGRPFVGGADIRAMAALRDADEAREFILLVHGCCRAVRDCPVPVLARIEGYALGAGLELAAACDLRIAGEDARFGMPEVRVGIPSVVEAALLPSLIGWGRTRRLLLLGEIIGAAEALEWGLVERVAPASGLDGAVEEWLAHLDAAGPLALRSQKALMRRWENLPADAAIAAGVDAFAGAWASDEPVRMMRRFLDRPRPGAPAGGNG